MKRDEIILSDFLSSLEGKGISVSPCVKLAEEESHEVLKKIFSNWDKNRRRIYFATGVGFIYVNVRADPPGWWGLDSNVMDDLTYLRKECNISSRIILLVGRKDRKDVNGYIVSSLDDPPVIESPEEKNGKYNVYETNHLDRLRKRSSLASTVDALIKSTRNSNEA